MSAMSPTYETGPTDVAAALFSIIVVECGVLPRIPGDQGLLGGHLSKPFRKLLVVLVSITLARSISGGLGFGAHWVLLSIESLVYVFTSLLVPHLIKKQLEDERGKRALPSRYDIMPWLIGIAGLSIVGLTVNLVLKSNKGWVFKKAGDALSAFPVIRILQLVKSLRGSDVTMETLVVIEWNVLACNVGSAMAFFMDAFLHEEYVAYHAVLKAVKLAAHHTAWLRIFMHTLLLNQLDGTMHKPRDREQARQAPEARPFAAADEYREPRSGATELAAA